MSFGLFLLGALLVGMLLVEYFVRGHKLPGPSSAVDHLAVTGLMFVIMGFSTFCFTLLLHATGVKFGRSPSSSDEGTLERRLVRIRARNVIHRDIH